MGLLSACTLGEPGVRQISPDEVRARADVERRIALGNPGTVVCREMRLGIGTLDWVRGSVERVEGDRVVVRVSDEGRFKHTIGGVTVERGTIVRDDLAGWSPCR